MQHSAQSLVKCVHVFAVFTYTVQQLWLCACVACAFMHHLVPCVHEFCLLEAKVIELVAVACVCSKIMRTPRWQEWDSNEQLHNSIKQVTTSSASHDPEHFFYIGSLSFSGSVAFVA